MIVNLAVLQPPEQGQRHVHPNIFPQRFQVQGNHGAVEAQYELAAHDPHLVFRLQLKAAGLALAGALKGSSITLPDSLLTNGNCTGLMCHAFACYHLVADALQKAASNLSKSQPLVPP